MSLYKVGVEELAHIIANGYKDVLEYALKDAIKVYTDPIIEDAVIKLAKQIDASVNSYYQVEKNNIMVELYIDKTKLEWKDK